MTTILVVDDEFGLVDTLADLLADEGYRVVTASNGQEGLALVAAERPDLALVDVMMPILGGVEMVRRLRELPAHRTLPVILMSAAPQPPVTRQKGNPLAIAAFLRKPFHLGELLHLIEQVKATGARGSHPAGASAADRHA